MYTSRILVSCTRSLRLLLAFAFLCAGVSNAQKLSQDPGHKEYLSISGVRFSSPNGFDAQRFKTEANVAYVPHQKYDLGLFVAAPNKA